MSDEPIEEDCNPTPHYVCAVCSRDMIVKKESMIIIREKYLCAPCSYVIYRFLEDFFKDGHYNLVFDEKELEKCPIGLMRVECEG